MRDDFSKKTIETLAKRAGNSCSNPICQKITSGPHSLEEKSITIGVAAHITAASKNGPRYDYSLPSDKRKHISNGIWLCQDCAKLIDSDTNKYTVEAIRFWKKQHESYIGQLITKSSQNSGLLTPGCLNISDVQVIQNDLENYALVDFRVSNHGGSDIIINKIKFEVAEVLTRLLLGHADFSHIYDLDISKLNQYRDSVSLNVAQLLKPGEADRFGIRISAPSRGPTYSIWRLIPTLITNFGIAQGAEIELWLPKKINPPLQEAKQKLFEIVKETVKEFGVNNSQITKEKKLENGGWNIAFMLYSIIWYSGPTNFLITEDDSDSI